MAIYLKNIQIPKISQLGGGQWEISDLNDITILFGRNGSGKSVLLRSWRDKSVNDVHYVAPERTGEMDMQPHYMKEEIEPSGRKGASTTNYVPEYRRRIVSRIQAYFMTRGNFRGDCAAPGSPEDIEKFIRGLLPDFDLTMNASTQLPYKLERTDKNEIISSVTQLSSGEAQLFTIALDILTIASMWEINKQITRIILIDEPDVHIHPDLQVRFADFICQLSQYFKLQFVIATHSTSLLAAIGQLGREKASVIYLNRIKSICKAQNFSSIHRELTACLGGHVLMGPLFGAPILLVEGDDDYRIWSQVPRHHITSFAVIPSNGDEIKKYQKTLENILSSLREDKTTPCGYALLDGDKPLPSPNTDNPQENINFIKLSCHESENLYLCDEVLADMETTWEQAKDKIKKSANKYGDKEAQLLTVDSWNRQEADIKSVINQIAEILDPKLLPWTLRLGKVIGKSMPQGQLAEFLGGSVISSLWAVE